MKNYIFFLAVLLFVSCNNKQIIVYNNQELNAAVNEAVPGSEIVLADGIWKDLKLIIKSKGTEKRPVIIKAQHKGKVFIEGKSFIKLGGEFIIIKDFYFRNGYSPSDAIVKFKINEDSVASNCTITNCVFYNFTKPAKYEKDHWIEFWGRNNTLSNCFISGKINQGPTIRVYLSGNQNIWTYHQIKNNYFAERPRLGGPHGETIQVGESNTSMTPAYVSITNNLFEKCNGEVEVISIKSNFNNIENNIFKYSEGSLVLRHGNYNIVNGNIFIGDGKSKYFGGIRVINSGHWITNNFFYELLGENFRAPLAVMNGIPKSPLNRYNQVTDVVVAYNSWIDCVSPLQFSVGANIDKKDFLPASEIRSARPKRVIVANNLIYDRLNHEHTIVSYDKLDGIDFFYNYIDNPDLSLKKTKGFKCVDIELIRFNHFLAVPGDCEDKPELYEGYGFESIKTDLLMTDRNIKNCYGAIVMQKNIPDLNNLKYGAGWFVMPHKKKPSVIEVTSNDDFSKVISKANAGDTILLVDNKYVLNSSILVKKDLVIKNKTKQKVKIIFDIHTDSAAINLRSGNLKLFGLNISCINNSGLFLSSKSARYNLFVNGCSMSDFRYILKANIGSFADTISFNNSTFRDFKTGIDLAAEINNNGNYNAEYVGIINCNFKNIKGFVVNYFRGGYDESTIGGILQLKYSKIKNCGKYAQGSILLNTHGIVNVNIEHNIFENNVIQYIAVLWQEKNYFESNNTIINSGAFEKVAHLKQSLMY